MNTNLDIRIASATRIRDLHAALGQPAPYAGTPFQSRWHQARWHGDSSQSQTPAQRG